MGSSDHTKWRLAQRQQVQQLQQEEHENGNSNSSNGISSESSTAELKEAVGLKHEASEKSPVIDGSREGGRREVEGIREKGAQEGSKKRHYGRHSEVRETATIQHEGEVNISETRGESEEEMEGETKREGKDITKETGGDIEARGTVGGAIESEKKAKLARKQQAETKGVNRGEEDTFDESIDQVSIEHIIDNTPEIHEYWQEEHEQPQKEENVKSEAAANTKKEGLRMKKEKKGERETFISSHFRVDEEALQQYLTRKNIQFRISGIPFLRSPFSFNSHTLKGGEVVVKECPWCPSHKDKLDNMWKLNISRLHGAYMCHRCSAHGSWYDFKAKMGDIPQVCSPQVEVIELI